jgi:hypothetical protein
VADRLRVAVAVIAVTATVVGWLAAPSPALACLASRCMDPFRVWLGDSPVAVYELDRSASSWAAAPRQTDDQQDAGFDDRCILRGAFTFRRVEAIRGATPVTIVTRVPRGIGDCPSWDMRGSWAPAVMRSPSGRWIVATRAEASREFHVVAFYHLDSMGHIDNDGAYPSDYPDPDTLPMTVAGWRAALGPPPTDAEPQVAPAGSDGTSAGYLFGGGVLGLAAGLWRSRRARREAAE